jgi:DNA-binding response OmpR family regulator
MPRQALKNACNGIMASSDERLPTTGRSSDDLTGLDVLLVEDSWDVGQAVKALLELCGATVAGPAATVADAELLLARYLPDVAIVDLYLRGGERSDSLIGRLRKQGVPIITLSGSFELGSLPSIAGAIILEKPLSEAQLIAHLSPLIAKKRLAEGF